MEPYPNSVVIIAAVALNSAIGKDGKLPWEGKLPSDLRRFKELTMSKQLVMGRRTFESLPAKKLPGRDIIVLTKGGGMDTPRVRYAPCLKEALAMPRISRDIYIAGGAGVYREALKYAHKMLITTVSLRPEGDTFFPDFGPEWDVVNAPRFERCPGDAYDSSFAIWVRMCW